jgi:hypothetical protein
MDTPKCSHHVRLPGTRLSCGVDFAVPTATCRKGDLRETRVQIPVRIVLALAFFALISPTTAFDDESQTILYASRSRHHGYWTSIAFCLSLLFLVGHKFINVSITLVEPLMGITSVLWLMMRNDAAISPKASWM